MTDVVLFEELACENGHKIGLVTLNSPRSLNALSSDMIDLLYPQLDTWKNQDDIAAVFIQGEGDKAFCAGGDIVHMYNAMKQASNEKLEAGSPEITTYFTKEYALDFLIHTFNKPFVVWGSGIVMGGGLGLMVGGSHRVVTETSRIAMPEIGIGLYPDVGASHFLNKMPKGVGLFLGLTGASINAIDAKYCSLADAFIEHKFKTNFIEKLTQLNFSKHSGHNHQEISQLIATFEEKSQASLTETPITSQLNSHKSLINEVTSPEELADIVNAILAVKTQDKWFVKAQKSLQRGSALSAKITFKQLALGQSMSLAQCFQMELGLSVRCGQFGEFSEGVRALLIDKDNAPCWRFPNVEAVDETLLDWFFESQWEDNEHPLGNLTDNDQAG
jgi:enoyl-CoA hydratase/carnithine racemase